MVVTHSIAKIRRLIQKQRDRGASIGFMPSMGALHQGHLSLVRAAVLNNDFVAVSVFVNPLQFGPQEDYRRYPRPLKQDRTLLEKEGVDLVFYPEPQTFYHPQHSVYVQENDLSVVLCGKSRPGHFQGVCTVLIKLFNAVEPDVAYFGQKDYQQALIARRLVRDLNLPIAIKILPIVREADSLAMSSRNCYLNQKQRDDARCLYEALLFAQHSIAKGKRDVAVIIKGMKKIISVKKSTYVDYIAVANAETLKPLKKVKGKVLVALAVRIGKIRLIDNLIIHGKT